MPRKPPFIDEEPGSGYASFTDRSRGRNLPTAGPWVSSRIDTDLHPERARRRSIIRATSYVGHAVLAPRGDDLRLVAMVPNDMIDGHADTDLLAAAPELRAAAALTLDWFMAHAPEDALVPILRAAIAKADGALGDKELLAWSLARRSRNRC